MISENPLSPGIKKVCFKSSKDDKEFLSDQQIIILREKDNKKMSKIIKFTQNSNIEILNNDSKLQVYFLILLSLMKIGLTVIIGRALPNSNIKLF